MVQFDFFAKFGNSPGKSAFLFWLSLFYSPKASFCQTVFSLFFFLFASCYRTPHHTVSVLRLHPYLRQSLATSPRHPHRLLPPFPDADCTQPHTSPPRAAPTSALLLASPPLRLSARIKLMPLFHLHLQPSLNPTKPLLLPQRQSPPPIATAPEKHQRNPFFNSPPPPMQSSN